MFAAVLLAASLFAAPLISSAQHLVLSQTVALPDVRGRLDHMDIDLDRGRLFVAALAAGSIEVLDLHGGTRAYRLEHLREPQGVKFMKERRRLFVAEGGGQRVDVFADTKQLAVVDGLDDADNMRLDASGGRLYVGYGSALAVLDPQAMSLLGRVPLAGHPEAFELATSSPLIYVNVPSAGHIAVVDRNVGKVVATWETAAFGQNFAMALDDRNHRLYVATRRPGMLLVIDTANGSRVAQLPIGDDADAVFFDSERARLYAICGEGRVDVIQVQDADHFRVVEHLQTSAGARTGLFVPELATLFVALPARGNSTAEVRAYNVR